MSSSVYLSVKSRQAAIFLGNLVKNAIEEGKRMPKRMEMSSDLGMCVKWILCVLFCQGPRDDER